MDIEASARLILDEIGDPPDLTLVRGVGNRGDDLIMAGTRELLADRIYREVDLAAMCGASGHTALLCGGGGFCRPYHDIMPRALAVAEMRFRRVIVLPSSLDPSEDQVRDALARTRAIVFAREPESFRRIVSLCDARLADDCAFFFDFTPWRRGGHGTLNAFRTDHEAPDGRPLPSDNDDISMTAATLDDWLETIADHATVRTDRAHVMIAAAVLGKLVEFAPSSYHKLPAIAEFSLTDYAVTRLPPVSAARTTSPVDGVRPRSPAAPAVTAIVLTRDRPQSALRTVDSLRSNGLALQTLVVDNNSAPAAAAELAEGGAGREGVVVRRSDRNLGCAGGRGFALEWADADYVLFVDDDAELEPGALDLLVADLEAHRDAAAVTATVVMPDGTVQHSGGWLEVSDGVADFSLIGAGERIVSSLPATGPAGWVPGTATLIRRDVLEEFPLDDQMSAYYEDNEWCYRVEQARPGSFRRSLEARAVHKFVLKLAPGLDLFTRSRAVELLRAHARFYERHGVLLATTFDFAPELWDAEGRRDLSAARVLMELLLAKGSDWTFMEWMNGNLAGMLGVDRELAARHATDDVERELAKHAKLMAFLHERHVTLERIENGGWWRLRRRLLPVLRVYSRLNGRSGR